MPLPEMGKQMLDLTGKVENHLKKMNYEW